MNYQYSLLSKIGIISFKQYCIISRNSFLYLVSTSPLFFALPPPILQRSSRQRSSVTDTHAFFFNRSISSFLTLSLVLRVVSPWLHCWIFNAYSFSAIERRPISRKWIQSNKNENKSISNALVQHNLCQCWFELAIIPQAFKPLIPPL